MDSLYNEENPSSETILADDLTKGWDSTDRLNDRISAYCTLKERSLEFYDWAMDGGIPQFNRDDTKIFRRLRDCGSYLIFRTYVHSNITRLIGSCSCKQHLICAFCASRRGVKNSVAYKEKVDLLKAAQPKQRLMLITFTVQNGDDLWERFTHLRTSMQALLKRRLRGRGHIFEKVNGGVFAYEFKRGSGLGKWHPHVHMLALVDTSTFLNHNELKQEWLTITGDSSVVNLEYADSDNAFLEVFAYALKFSEMDHPDRWFASKLLRSERLISSFGSFRGVEVDEDCNDELLDSEEPWYDTLYRFCVNRGYDGGTKIATTERKAA